MIRFATFAILALHGIAHSVGFLSAWGIGDLADAPYTTLILNGAVDSGDVGIRLIGLAWLVVGGAFIVVAIGAWRGGIVPRRVAVVAAISLGLCVIGLPAATIGIIVNLAILAGLGAVATMGPAGSRRAIR